MASHPDDVFAAAVAALSPSADALRSMREAFRAEIARSLAGRPSSLKMLPTFVRQPRGDEQGEALFLDWGGTHGRAGIAVLDGRGGVLVAREELFTFSEENKGAPADQVFDIMAAAVSRAVGAATRPLPLGFAYSYPARLERIDRAIALSLTKGWRTAGLEGGNVAELLARALARRGLDNVAVAAVANDTVASLALSSYRARGRDRAERPAEIGLIVGTGTNQAADFGEQGIRNLESGNFDGMAALETPWDAALDREVEDPAPGAQRFEKMAAGHYLGEIARRIVADLGARTSLFRSWRAPALASTFGVDSAALSRLEADRSPSLADTDRLLRDLSIESSLAERRALLAIGRAVVTRSARLIAAALVGTLSHIDPRLDRAHRIAVDGSLYGGYPGYDRLVRRGIEEQCGSDPASRLALEFAKDSTGLGAAVIAAVASAPT